MIEHEQSSPSRALELSRRSNAFFEVLDRDIRNLVYKYLFFAPMLHLDNEASGSGFAATCHQAKNEAEEEGLRQFWIFLQQVKNEYDENQGQKLHFPAKLTSKDALRGLKHLTITILEPMGPLPSCLDKFCRISLVMLTIHCIGKPSVHRDAPYLVNAIFTSLVKDILDFRPRLYLQRFVFSWDYRSLKSDTALKGARLDFKPEVKEQYRTYGDGKNITTWPTITYGKNDTVDLGFFDLDLGSRCEVARTSIYEMLPEVRDHLNGFSFPISATTATDVVRTYAPTVEG